MKVIKRDGKIVDYDRAKIKIAKEQITKKHLIAFEIDEDHKEDMHKLCKKYFPSDNIVIEKDLAGKNRYAFIYSE